VAFTYQQLKGKTVAELREIAKDVHHDSVQGYSQMNKEHLLPALCSALGIDMREHHTVQGIDKSAIKARMRTLKAQRDEALEAHNADELRSIRRQIHRLNRQIRAHLS
jgi:DNA-binding IclR family transcriptional regulator